MFGPRLFCYFRVEVIIPSLSTLCVGFMKFGIKGGVEAEGDEFPIE